MRNAAMTSFFLGLYRALATPDGSNWGELLSVRRKSHLLQAEWYARLAATGEAERKPERHTGLPHEIRSAVPAKQETGLLAHTLP
jgi:hypothetical protein